MYVLSLPGFVWFRVDVDSTYRSSHACIIPNNRQMIIVGGSANANGAAYEKRDEFAQGLGVFDLPTLSWKDRYDADAGPYEPPQRVADWYNAGYALPTILGHTSTGAYESTFRNLDKVQWTNDKVKSLFGETSMQAASNFPTLRSRRLIFIQIMKAT